MKSSRKAFALIACLTAFACSSVFAAGAQGDYYPAKVKDISDRSYEGAVIELLDNAKESIVMSMYIVHVEEKGPVRLLIQDLEEAAARGVSVELYVNSRVDHGAPEYCAVEGALKRLVDKGAKVYKFSRSFRLHDKLIIVDSRYVVEGKLKIAGTGPLEELVRKSVNDKIQFLGFVDETRKQELLRGTQCVIFPSEWHEPFGRSVIEAYIEGVPVIASRIGGSAELVKDGFTGELFAAGDVKDLHSKIEYIINNPQERDRMGANACTFAVDNFSEEKNCQELMVIYNKLMEIHKKNGEVKS